jgi:glutamate carboxypeptidase
MRESRLLAACAAAEAWMLATVERLAALESPSDDKAAVDRVVDALAAIGAELGFRASRVTVDAAGDHLRLESGPPRAAASRRVLLLGHTDTVWPVGTLAAMPIARRDGTLTGPGVYDMKAGLVIGLQAMRALVDAGGDGASITLLATSDEEVGSATSRALIEAEAREADAVLVLEPSLESAPGPLGGVKTGRKGVGEFRIEVTGVAAHAGVEPEKGASAVHELARQILAIEALARPERGTTINAGVIGGGSRGNVVAEHAWAQLDVRVLELAEARRVEDALRRLPAVHPRARLRVHGAVNRPPLEPSLAGQRLYGQAVAVAAALGHDLPAGTVGGASDGNFTAALGIPTIDGLGPVGGGAHARHEHVRIASLPLRAALVAALIDRLSAT